ncbi:SDR family oxidoreductase [Alteromonas sediminis]|uniref:SDR family oxidoreductase n=1 Tax=Alteromonas sediminis TaxID=2259342 RepID=A0A3N5XYI3_9ALTE|nr:SDR family oxidoreductase [Alteromonas sediminis]RPJ64976.1 SDR family oxidoreductase [Alteromonas sediminis]
MNPVTTPIYLITGTSKGIGEALANYYLQQGVIVVGCSRSHSNIEHESYYHHSVDVTDEQSVKHLFTWVRKTFGRLDVLINNAGIAAMNHAILTPASSVERILQTNVLASFICCREAAKIMKKKAFGRIVNFSTVAVPLNLEGEAAYAASKSGVETLTRVLAREFAEFNITVNAVGPTPIQTELIKNVGDDKINALLARQTLKRMGTFDDVINVVNFFVDEKSDFISAQVVYLGGV